ncbi:MAG: transporter substrate-binding domain-containing protein [Candidatus Methylomirabilales bacterium]
MWRWTWVLAVGVALGLSSCASARPGGEEPRSSRDEPTLTRIARTGVFTVGTQPDAIPFSVRNNRGEWQGFSVALARMVRQRVERELGHLVELKFVRVTPATRIPRLRDGTVDMIAEVMTNTRERDRLVDFSITVFVTGQQLLVRGDSRIQSHANLVGKRVGADRGTTNADTIQKLEPRARLVLYDSASRGFQALQAGTIDAYTNDGVVLAGLKVTAGDPAAWRIVGDPISYEPYAFAMRENDSRFRDLVNHTLMEAIESRKYIALYNTWLGPVGLVPYPLSKEAQAFLLLQVVPPS